MQAPTAFQRLRAPAEPRRLRGRVCTIDCGKQRQIVDTPRCRRAVCRSRLLPESLRTSRARATTVVGQARELRHLDAIRAVGGAGLDLVQEHDLVVPLAHVHRDVRRSPRGAGQARSARGSGWQTARAALVTSCRYSTVAQAIDSPSNVAVPRPISSRMTSERSVAWLRIAAVSTISTMKVERPRARSSDAPTRQNSRSTMPMCGRARRHERAHLRQHHDERVLAQEGRFAGHVGAGDKPDAVRRASRPKPARSCSCRPGPGRSRSR